MCVPFVRDGTFGYAMVARDGFGLVPIPENEGGAEVEAPLGPLRRM
ncbi:hypothetical protein IMZ48_25105 [Candidatus Bathyarchaeota archaeon]|nr:hypothetical protein [Candidatus Bathyarchaeota archaeon]